MKIIMQILGKHIRFGGFRIIFGESPMRIFVRAERI